MDLMTVIKLKAMSGSEPQTEEATASGNPATFTTDIVKPLSALSVSFAPVQAGSGDPTEQNKRDISGKSSIKVSVSGGEDHTIPLGDTYYGGSLNVLTGVLTVEWGFVSGRWGDLESQGPNQTTGYYQKVLYCSFNQKRCVDGTDYGENIICNCIGTVLWDSAACTPQHLFSLGSSTNKKVYLYGNFDNDLVVQVAIKLESPITVQLTGQQVKDVLGENSISADTNGTVSLTYLKIAS